MIGTKRKPDGSIDADAMLEHLERPDRDRRARRQQFIKFPVVWQERLAGIRAHGCTYRVGLHLLRQSWSTGNPVVKLTNAGLKCEGVGRDGKAVALRELQMAGLVTIERQTRKSPRVTVCSM